MAVLNTGERAWTNLPLHRLTAPKQAMAKLSAQAGTIERGADGRLRIDTVYEVYLAPYQAIIGAEERQLDRDDMKVEDRIYDTRDFDRTLVMDGRTQLVAQKITAFLKESGNRFQKAIVFCVDQEHAARMRHALINDNTDLVEENFRYVMRITSSDAEGQDELCNFIDPESKYPVLVTTSRLLSTGVDVQICRLIVLERVVGSMAEFKQIVGRGTRVHEDAHKFHFAPLDFRGAAGHFADLEFDGDPVQVYEPGEGDPIDPPDTPPADYGSNPFPGGHGDGEPVAVLVGCQHCDPLVSPRRSFVETYREFTQDIDLAELAFDPDELFAGMREETPGRDVRLRPT